MILREMYESLDVLREIRCFYERLNEGLDVLDVFIRD